MEKINEQKEFDWDDFFKKYKIKSSNKKTFLKAFDARMLNVSAACKSSCISRATYYLWINKLDTFKKAIEELSENFYDKLETVMFTKAITEQDNTLLIFLAKSKMPQRGYIDHAEVNANVSGVVSVNQDLSALSDEEVELFAKMQKKIRTAKN